MIGTRAVEVGPLHREESGAMAWWQAATALFALMLVALGLLFARETWPTSSHLAAVYSAWASRMVVMAKSPARVDFAAPSAVPRYLYAQNQRAAGLVEGFGVRDARGPSDATTFLLRLSQVDLWLDRMLDRTMSESGARRARDGAYIRLTVGRSVLGHLPMTARAAGSSPVPVRPVSDQAAIGLSDRVCAALRDVERRYYQRFSPGGMTPALTKRVQNVCALPQGPVSNF